MVLNLLRELCSRETSQYGNIILKKGVVHLSEPVDDADIKPVLPSRKRSAIAPLMDS